MIPTPIFEAAQAAAQAARFNFEAAVSLSLRVGLKACELGEFVRLEFQGLGMPVQSLFHIGWVQTRSTFGAWGSEG